MRLYDVVSAKSAPRENSGQSRPRSTLLNDRRYFLETEDAIDSTITIS